MIILIIITILLVIVTVIVIDMDHLKVVTGVVIEADHLAVDGKNDLEIRVNVIIAVIGQDRKIEIESTDETIIIGLHRENLEHIATVVDLVVDHVAKVRRELLKRKLLQL